MNDRPEHPGYPPAADGRCKGPYGVPENTGDCPDAACFEVGRYHQRPLLVCPVHLGPALLMAPGVLWPPRIILIR